VQLRGQRLTQILTSKLLILSQLSIKTQNTI
jgi:hypothetical protein